MADDWQKQMEHRMADLEERQTNTAQRLNGAFPGGDAEGHRRYHELQIEKLEETRKLRIAIQEKTISGLIWAGLVGVSIACWKYLIGILHP